MAELKEGSKAPDFTLTDDAGRKVKLSEFADKTVVLYFYPRADTPGCTKEACSFRDHHAELLARGAVVLGVSPDEAARLAKFKQKYGLPFPLLADPDHKVAEKYGVWVEKNMYGRKTMGIERSTFLIHHGKIAKIFRKVKVDGHTEEVLAALDAIAG
jgi:peroxiredoxin Q/BCP